MRRMPGLSMATSVPPAHGHAEIGGGQRRHSFGASTPPSQHAAVANQDLAACDGARHALARQCTQHKPAALGGTHARCAQWMLAVALQA